MTLDFIKGKSYYDRVGYQIQNMKECNITPLQYFLE